LEKLEELIIRIDTRMEAIESKIGIVDIISQDIAVIKERMNICPKNCKETFAIIDEREKKRSGREKSLWAIATGALTAIVGKITMDYFTK
jgi:hypothetical protein